MAITSQDVKAIIAAVFSAAAAWVWSANSTMARTEQSIGSLERDVEATKNRVQLLERECHAK